MLRLLAEAGRPACGGGRMCVSLRETVGDMDVDDEATWTYSRRVSRRDTHIRCAPSRKRGTRLRAQGALLRVIVLGPGQDGAIAALRLGRRMEGGRGRQRLDLS